MKERSDDTCNSERRVPKMLRFPLFSAYLHEARACMYACTNVCMYVCMQIDFLPFCHLQMKWVCGTCTYDLDIACVRPQRFCCAVESNRLVAAVLTHTRNFVRRFSNNNSYYYYYYELLLLLLLVLVLI